MRTWFGSLLFVVLGTFAIASGCGSPEVIHGGDDLLPDASMGGDSNADAGTGATGANLHLGDGGANTGCVSTCTDLNANCGVVTDTRCGGVIECGTCPTGQICGGDGPNRCGTGMSGDAGACSGPNCQNCTPKTCDDLGFSCGPAGDTCGGKLDCGSNTCPILGWTCGGGTQPGQCGCTGTCSQLPDCSAEPIKTTSLTGKVYDPAGNNPLYHVFVYVANDPTDSNLKSFPKGITCDVCGATAAGSPLLSEGDQFGTYTDVDGSFSLKNVPVGKGVTLVIQLGRWRRVFTVDIDTPCAPNAIPDKTLLMPSKQAEGNIPLMAMVTGKADSLECVLRKMGIDGTEFTNPSAGGRVQFYLGTGDTDANGSYGQKIDAQTPKQSALFVTDPVTNQPVINGYDMTILACQGGAFAESAANQSTLRGYAASGGRVFTTHYSYTWLTGNDENTLQKGLADNWSEVATWHVDENDRADNAVAHIDLTSNPKGAAFQGWLEAVGASAPGSGTTSVNVIRHDANSISSVAGQTQQWLYRDGANAYAGQHLPLHFTFNTPVNRVQDLTTDPPALQCGRVLFSDFHVQDASEHDVVFPNQCGKACTLDTQCATGGKCASGFCLDPMTPQEKLLEYMIFDLGSCVPPPKSCQPIKACPKDANCGYVPDGCGDLLYCGDCPSGETCGVGDPPVANQCGKGTATCTPKTCGAQQIECGPAGDGCGEKIDSCGLCDAGELCVQGKCTRVN